MARCKITTAAAAEAERALAKRCSDLKEQRSALRATLATELTTATRGQVEKELAAVSEAIGDIEGAFAEISKKRKKAETPSQACSV